MEQCKGHRDEKYILMKSRGGDNPRCTQIINYENCKDALKVVGPRKVGELGKPWKF